MSVGFGTFVVLLGYVWGMVGPNNQPVGADDAAAAGSLLLLLPTLVVLTVFTEAGAAGGRLLLRHQRLRVAAATPSDLPSDP